MKRTYTTDLVRRLATKHRRSQAHYRAAITEIFGEIAEQLGTGHHVQLTQFGTFYTRLQPAAKIKDIRSGKPVTVPAHRVAAFHVGQAFKRAAHTKVRSTKPRRKRTGAK